MRVGTNSFSAYAEIAQRHIMKALYYATIFQYGLSKCARNLRLMGDAYEVPNVH